MTEFDVEEVFVVALKAVKDAGKVEFNLTFNSDLYFIDHHH